MTACGAVNREGVVCSDGKNGLPLNRGIASQLTNLIWTVNSSESGLTAFARIIFMSFSRTLSINERMYCRWMAQL